jgi:hypothetical protein
MIQISDLPIRTAGLILARSFLQASTSSSVSNGGGVTEALRFCYVDNQFEVMQ